MLQVLLILLFLSILGIGVILVQERKHRDRILLHYLKKSCNIDSIVFEKNLRYTKKMVYRFLIRLHMFFQTTMIRIHTLGKAIVYSSKKKIRQTLFRTHKKGVVSDFISYMKDTSHKE